MMVQTRINPAVFRHTNITVTATATTLQALLTTALSGTEEPPGRRLTEVHLIPVGAITAEDPVWGITRALDADVEVVFASDNIATDLILDATGNVTVSATCYYI